MRLLCSPPSIICPHICFITGLCHYSLTEISLCMGLFHLVSHCKYDCWIVSLDLGFVISGQICFFPKFSHTILHKKYAHGSCFVVFFCCGQVQTINWEVNQPAFNYCPPCIYTGHKHQHCSADGLLLFYAKPSAGTIITLNVKHAFFQVSTYIIS